MRKDLDTNYKGKPQKRKRIFFLITAQNNAIRTNYIIAKIDNMKQNCKCWLCREKNETINCTLNDGSHFSQEMNNIYIFT